MSSYYTQYLAMVQARDNVFAVLTILALAWVAGWWLLPKFIKDNHTLLESARISYTAVFVAAMLMIVSVFVRLSNG